MEANPDLNRYNRARLDDRQVTELVGIARGMLADDFLSDKEVEFLQKWLVANEGVTANPMVNLLSSRLDDVLADKIIDNDERDDLFQLLKALISNDFEIGEAIRSTVLPLCSPRPHIDFDGARFCFTGTFIYGSRSECEEQVAIRGGSAGGLSKKTDFLVIGEYATDSWVQSSFGRKIEKAVDMRQSGIPIKIVSEPHWRTSLW